MKKIALISGLMAVLLAGCGNHDQQAQVIQPQQQQVAQGQVIQQDPQPQIVQQPVAQQPVIIQQAPPVVVQQDNSGAAMATGMALGMMADGGSNRTEVIHHYHSAPAPVIVNKTYVNKTVVQAAPQPQVVVNKTTIVNTRPPVMRPSYAATSSNSSYKSVRTVTTTTRR